MLSEKERIKDDNDDDVLDNAIASGEKAEAEGNPEGNPEYDKARQQAEQYAANARKATELAEQRQQQLEETRAETESLKARLAEAQAKAAENDVHIPELDEQDYSDGDVPIVKAIKGLQKAIIAKDQRIAALEKARSGYEANVAKDEAARRRNEAYHDLLGDLDSEYGPEHRNAAVKLFNEKADAGEVPANNPAKATRMMEKCYKQAVATKKKVDKDSPLPLDSGTGGGSAMRYGQGKLKPGSLDEVADQAAQMTLR